MKKTYIIPATAVVMLSQTDALLVSLSGGSTLGTGGTTNGNVTTSDTKTSGDWSDIWNNK